MTNGYIAIGDIVTYKLLSRHLPKNPQKLWKGKVTKSVLELGLVWVTSTEEGYIGLEELLLVDQIVEVKHQHV